jgi:hypothetical protein
VTFTHSTTDHRSGRVEHKLVYQGPEGDGRLRWLHISDDEAWVLEWAVRPQRVGIGSKLMDVLTGRTEVDGFDFPGYRWFRAADGNWAEPFEAWAAHRDDITHKPRPLDAAAVMFTPEQREAIRGAMEDHE